MSILLWMRLANASTTPDPTAETLEQYTSGGHVFGFEAGGFYFSNGAYALRVSYDKGAAVAPMECTGERAAMRNGRSTTLNCVAYRDLWPGISVVYDAPSSGIARSTWKLEAGAPPAAIRLRYNRAVTVTESGELAISFATGVIKESPPVAWQDVDGQRQQVDVEFVRREDGTLGFRVGPYRADLPLTIDPTLTWNTFLGGDFQDESTSIAVDSGGDIYVAGYSQVAWGSPVRAFASDNDAFVAKLSSGGTLIWNTFLGGVGSDIGTGIALDGNGSILVTGGSSTSWGSPRLEHTADHDAFVAKLTSRGELRWNTFLGGSGTDYGLEIAVAGDGSVYVAGYSKAAWGNPVRGYTSSDDAFAAQLTSSGNLTWSTFLGGEGADLGYGIAVDRSGSIFVSGYSDATWENPVRAYTSGSDAFAAQLSPSGALTWNTFLGGSGGDLGFGIALDTAGNASVTGHSSAPWGSPVRAFTSPARLPDAFVAQITPTGALLWNTFLGGSGIDLGYSIAIDGSGDIVVAGFSEPGWGDPIRPYESGGDAFAAQVSPEGALVWNTFLGGRSFLDWGWAIAVGDNGDVYVAGYSIREWGNPTGHQVHWDAMVAQLEGKSANDTPTRTPTMPNQTPAPPTPTQTRTAARTPTATPTAMSTSTVRPSPTPTRTRRPVSTPGPCVGDCDADGEIEIAELIRGVAIALEIVDYDACPVFDANRNGRVQVGELLHAVNGSLDGCIPL